MKKYFITGLVILLPLTLTVGVILFIANLLTAPFVGVVGKLLNHFHLLERGFLFLSAEDVRLYVSQFLVILFLVCFTTLLGFLARLFFFSSLLKLWDYILHRIPFVRTIYKTSQEVIQTILSSQGGSFKQVVLVHFPNADTQSIGFVTKENLPLMSEEAGGSLVGVFVPTTPLPTAGFLLIYREEELVYLDMKVEEAFKYIISFGVIMPPTKTISKQNTTT